MFVGLCLLLANFVDFNCWLVFVMWLGLCWLVVLAVYLLIVFGCFCFRICDTFAWWFVYS